VDCFGDVGLVIWAECKGSRVARIARWRVRKK